jgi:TPR repeat protein
MQTRSSTGFNAIPENVAAVVFSHLGDDPRDRVALAQVSKVWRDAEKSDASLPGGSPSALFELGEGLYAAKKCKRAIYWWRRATGDADAMYWIGVCYRFAYGVKGDVTKAVEWFERASRCGHAEATFSLAQCYEYEYGLDVGENKTKALELYLKAAELGQKGAAYKLGVIYYHGGCGVAVNKTEALKWWRVAVELGDTFVQGAVTKLEAELATA